MAYEPGNVYRATVSPETLRTTPAVIDRTVARPNEGQSMRPDADLLNCEIDLTARMLRHACHHGRLTSGAPAMIARGPMASSIGLHIMTFTLTKAMTRIFVQNSNPIFSRVAYNKRYIRQVKLI